jgi:hypothetical protein
MKLDLSKFSQQKQDFKVSEDEEAKVISGQGAAGLRP